MKKFFMTIAAVAVAATMNAQVYVGGNIGVTSQSQDGNSTTKVSFNPEVGYMFNDKMGVGMELTILTHGEQATANYDNGNIEKKTPTTIGFAPYFRYKFVNNDNLDLFVDAAFVFATTSASNVEIPGVYSGYINKATNAFGFAIKPGVAYKATDHLSFVAKLGLLGFTSEKVDVSGAKARNTFNFMVGTDNFASNVLEFGLFYNF